VSETLEHAFDNGRKAYISGRNDQDNELTPFNEMYSLLPVLSAIFPVLCVIATLCVLEVEWRDLASEPCRTYRCWTWYLASMAVLSLLACKAYLLELEKLLGKLLGLFLPNSSHVDEITGWTQCAIIPLALALVAIGIWQPLWKGDNKKILSIIFKFLPVILILAALLGPLSVLVSIFFWPVGMFVVEPLVLGILVAIVFLSVKRLPKR